MTATSILSNFWAPSDGKPFTASEEDKATYLAAKVYFENLNLPDIVTGGTRQKIISVNFDGTGNNETYFPSEITNVVRIKNTLNASDIISLYIPGIGTEGSWQTAQQVFALQSVTKVKDALAKVSARCSELSGGEPDNFYLIVTGFSRGSAEARLFMNFIDTYGVPAVGDEIPDDLTYDLSRSQIKGGVIHMSALLYDTVTTGMSGDFSIPGSVDSVVHLTSRDEKRVYFPLTSVEAGPGQATNRLIEVQLPGVHSDIGGGYGSASTSDIPSGDGVAQLNLYFSELVLRDWGLPIAAPTLPDLNAVSTWTEHDSRSLGTRLWYLWGALEPAVRNTSFPGAVALTPDEVAALDVLYRGIPGGWRGDALMPSAIQSPPHIHTHCCPATPSL